MQGDPAPGTSLNFLSFDKLSLNADGKVSFQGELSSAAQNSDFGLWSGDENGLTLIAREGDALPERANPPTMSGAFASPFQEAFLGDDGAVLYRVSTNDSNTQDALVHWNAGTSHVLLTALDQAAGTADGVLYGHLGVGQFRPSGQFMFYTLLTGTGVNSDNQGAIFVGDQNGFSLAVRDQTSPPGAVGTLAATGNSPALSSAGKVAFSGFTMDEVGNFKRSIYYGAPGTLALVALQGNSGFNLLSRASVNGSGVTVFDSTLSSGRALFSGAAGDVQRVLGVGDIAPGEKSVTFQEGMNGLLADLFQINDAGVIATNAHIAGPNLDPMSDNGLYMGPRDDLQLVARAGIQAVGFSTGKKYGDGAFPAQLNEAGNIAFTAAVSGVTVDSGDFAGLWSGKPGNLTLIAGAGQVLNLGPRGMKTIASIGATITIGTTLPNSSARTFNEAGQVFFRVKFTDGTQGIFRADEVANPNALTVNVSGMGSVTRGFAGVSTRVVGKSYTLTAVPAAGFLFVGWTGGVASEKARLTFKMTPGLTLTATFIQNPYLALAGAYSTILNSPGATPVGKVTASVTNAGALTGTLNLGGKRYTLHGKLALDGTYTQVIARQHLPSITVQLTFAAVNGVPTLTSGMADDTMTTVSVAGDAAQAKRLPEGLARGAFTMRLPAPGTSADPRGDGYATVTLSAQGALRFAGKLGDGTKLSAGAHLRQDSSTLLGVPLYRAPVGYIAGRLRFHTPPGNDADGPLSWVKPAQTEPGSQLYPAGFQSSISAILTRYTPPHSGEHIFTHAMPASATVQVSFQDGDVASFSHTIHLNGADKVTAIDGLAAGEKLDLSFTRASGLFSGHFQLPGSTHPTAFAGVILREAAQNRGDGLFLGSTESGAVHLAPQ